MMNQKITIFAVLLIVFLSFYLLNIILKKYEPELEELNGENMQEENITEPQDLEVEILKTG